MTRLQTARAEGTTTEGSLASPVPPSTDMEEDEFAFDSDDFDEPAPNTSAAGDTAATAVGPSHDESEDDASLCAALDEYERTAPALDMTVAALADDEKCVSHPSMLCSRSSLLFLIRGLALRCVQPVAFERAACGLGNKSIETHEIHSE